MKNNWQKVKLSEIIQLIGGGTPKTTNNIYWNGNIPWLSVVDFNDDNRYVTTTEKTITELGLQNSTTHLLDKGDIIISARGTVGAMAQLAAPMAFNQSCYGIKATEKSCNDFLYYLLKNSIGKLKKNTHGSVFNTITRDTFSNIVVSIPPLDEQRKIAGILSALDDKIELNNKINQNLEAQAQAIFKSWFVDFEPFKDQPFIDSPLGKIPQGWKVETLRDIAEITMGQSPSGSSYNEERFGMIFYQGRTDFGYRYPKIRLYTTEPKRIASAGSILLSVRAPVGDINKTINECCIGRGLASLKSNFLSFLYYQLQQMKDSFNVFNGEGTVFGSINKESLNRIKVIIPTSEILQRFEGIGNKLDKQIENNEIQTQALTQLRDTLLPKLMSGEIDVSEVAV